MEIFLDSPAFSRLFFLIFWVSSHSILCTFSSKCELRSLTLPGRFPPESVYFRQNSFFLRPFRMSLPNSSPAHGRSLPLLTFPRLLTLGSRSFTSLFLLDSLLILFDKLMPSFLTGELAQFLKIALSRFFRVRRDAPQASVLGAVFFCLRQRSPCISTFFRKLLILW